MYNREFYDKKAVRGRLMRERREAGLTLREVGREFGVTGSRIRQILEWQERYDRDHKGT